MDACVVKKKGHHDPPNIAGKKLLLLAYYGWQFSEQNHIGDSIFCPMAAILPMGRFGRRMDIRLSFDIYVITIHTQEETERERERERERESGVVCLLDCHHQSY